MIFSDDVTETKRMEMIQALRDAYRTIFENEDGDHVLDDLESRFHIHMPTFDSHTNTEQLAFREGQRSVVLYIKGMLIDDSAWQHLQSMMNEE